MSGTVTGLDLDRLEELAEQATPGPWEVDLNLPFSNEINGIFAPVSRQYVLRQDVECDEESELPLTEYDAEFIAAMRNAAPSLLAAARAVQRVEALCANEPGDEDEGRISKAMIRAALAPTILEAAEAARGSKLPKPMSAAALLREVAAADPAAHSAALARGYGVGDVLEAACVLCGYSERYAHHHDGQAKGYHPFVAALGTEQEGQR